MDKNNEDYGLRHIWGIKSADDMTGAECGLHTMNDLDITYDMAKQRYMLGVETIYYFEDKQHEHSYYTHLLLEFARWMESNGYKTDVPLKVVEMFNGNSQDFRSIEEAYTYFRIMINHYSDACMRERGAVGVN